MQESLLNLRAVRCLNQARLLTFERMVPKEGLEPSRREAQPPQDCVSTSSTTSAKIRKLIILSLKQVDCLLFQQLTA